MAETNVPTMEDIKGTLETAFNKSQAFQAEITAMTQEHQSIMKGLEAMKKAFEQLKA